jgi:hypothetical protein
MTHFDCRGTEEFTGSTSPAHQSTRRNYTGPDSAKLILLSITLTTDGENRNNPIQERNLILTIL